MAVSVADWERRLREVEGCIKQILEIVNRGDELAVSDFGRMSIEAMQRQGLERELAESRHRVAELEKQLAAEQLKNEHNRAMLHEFQVIKNEKGRITHFGLTEANLRLESLCYQYRSMLAEAGILIDDEVLR